MEIKPGDIVRVRGFQGVACRVRGYPQHWEPCTAIVADEDGGEIEVETSEGELVDDVDSGRIVVVMVGDDRPHTVEAEDCTLLDDLAYCAECGQIGCRHDGRERDD